MTTDELTKRLAELNEPTAMPSLRTSIQETAELIVELLALRKLTTEMFRSGYAYHEHGCPHKSSCFTLDYSEKPACTCGYAGLAAQFKKMQEGWEKS